MVLGSGALGCSKTDPGAAPSAGPSAGWAEHEVSSHRAEYSVTWLAKAPAADSIDAVFKALEEPAAPPTREYEVSYLVVGTTEYVPEGYSVILRKRLEKGQPLDKTELTFKLRARDASITPLNTWWCPLGTTKEDDFDSEVDVDVRLDSPDDPNRRTYSYSCDAKLPAPPASLGGGAGETICSSVTMRRARNDRTKLTVEEWTIGGQRYLELSQKAANTEKSLADFVALVRKLPPFEAVKSGMTTLATDCVSKPKP